MTEQQDSVITAGDTPEQPKRRGRPKKTPVTPVVSSEAEAPQDKVVMPVSTSFFKTRNSLFNDGYDIERERMLVAPLLEAQTAGQDVSSDPLYPRLQLYLDRRAQLEKRTKVRQDDSPQSYVSGREFRALRQLGGLTNTDEQDLITLHTPEAIKLFVGRSIDPDSQGQQSNYIISFKRVGAAYRLLWTLSSNNNPYADWALIGLCKKREVMQQQLQQINADFDKVIADYQVKRGIAIHVGVNRRPAQLPIRFRSPYGWQLVDCLAEFDYLVRTVKTLVHKARITQDDGEKIILKQMRSFRRHFNDVRAYEKYLADPDMMLLTRNDFLPAADDVAKGRVAKCIELFGNVPRAVFDLTNLPQFHKSRVSVSEQEMQLLGQVTVGVQIDNEDETAANNALKQVEMSGVG